MEKVFAFLTELSAHNNRDWMQAHKPQYQEAKGIFNDFIGRVLKGIEQFDQGVHGLAPKDCVFRINRDIRFSKNKDPYKTNFGAAMMEGGKKTGNPTYYLHIQPDNSFLAGGVYMPEPEALKKIRQEIDYNPGELKAIVEESKFKKTFGAMSGEQLKTAPKGYPKDHPNIELLRFKSFIVTKNLQDKEVLAANFEKRLIEDFEQLHPFNRYFAVAMS